ncbi:receptor-like protein 1 [Pistacia vera]|uniref:receptor-like protein 1 n=1 Tax=Pistacia vera TaxID=55513 RepID=UPI001263E5CE|nr:receptor-like protein 1 [Pistacia vera]
MERVLIKLSFWVVLVLVQTSGFNSCLENERIGLLDLKSFIKAVSVFQTEEILVSWVDDKMSNCCDWEEVQCNATTGRVIKLSLNHRRQFSPYDSFDRHPTLNLSLFHPFEELKSLYLSDNYFGGWHENKVYDGFKCLKQLKILDLSYNYFNATLLPHLNNLTSLTTLNLGWNKMGEGLNSAKQGLANLTNLKVLSLRDNQINNSLSSLGLANLTNLKRLDLSYNQINTSLPSLGLKYLKNLEELSMMENGLSGALNSLGLANLTNLKSLDLSYNQINTSLASLGLQNLKNLEELNMRWNGMDGSLTSLGLVNLTNLKRLDLSDNQIANARGLKSLENLEELYMGYNVMGGDSLTLGSANLTNLKILDLRSNQINNSLASLGICELKKLAELGLSFNSFDGHHLKCLSNLTYLKLLDLSSNQLSGKYLSSIIADLTSLEYLSLSDNNLEGSLTYDMFQPTSENRFQTYPLKVLNLLNCNLDAIPGFLLYHYNLRYVDLSDNKLVGTFPTRLLQNNTRLQVLRLRNNSFSGILQVPNSKCNLLHLDIAYNNFTGQLPENIGTILPKLLYIDMSRNCLKGNIPFSMGEMKRLSVLDLSSNDFSGELPDHFVNGCFSLVLLRLSDNNFHGQIFPRQMNLTQLQWLYLDNNSFSGKIGDGLLNATSLFFLNISNNKVSGKIPSWIGKFSYLAFLLMSKNLLEGTIPIQLNNLKSLEMLDVSENRLFGSIASDFNLSSVSYLYMQKNALSGSIPNSLFESSNLITLDLGENKFSGNIDPRWFNDHSTLKFLLLSGNHLQGHIPNQLCQLRNLSLLDLSHNRLNGSIPSCFSNLTLWSMTGEIDSKGFSTWFSWSIGCDALGVYHYDSSISFVTEEESSRSTNPEVILEVEFTMKNRFESYQGYPLEKVAGLDLSNNELTGEIPSKIGDLQGILALNLSYNLLSGPIPKSFSNLKEIESLDLSHNNLSGQIPPQLTQLNYLEVFNVAHNNLSGSIPNQAQFATFHESDYEGNPYLCGQLIKKSCTNAPIPPPLASIEEEDDNESVIDMVAFRWSFVGSYTTTIMALIMILWINPHWRRLWLYFIDICIDFCF